MHAILNKNLNVNLPFDVFLTLWSTLNGIPGYYSDVVHTHIIHPEREPDSMIDEHRLIEYVKSFAIPLNSHDKEILNAATHLEGIEVPEFQRYLFPYLFFYIYGYCFTLSLIHLSRSGLLSQLIQIGSLVEDGERLFLRDSSIAASLFFRHPRYSKQEQFEKVKEFGLARMVESLGNDLLQEIGFDVCSLSFFLSFFFLRIYS